MYPAPAEGLLASCSSCCWRFCSCASLSDPATLAVASEAGAASAAEAAEEEDDELLYRANMHADFFLLLPNHTVLVTKKELV